MLQFFKKSKIKCQFYLAKIQINNIPSQRLFKKLGFIEHFNDNVLVVYKKTKCNSK